IGSPLDPAVTLFQLGGDGLLRYVLGEDNTGNLTRDNAGPAPFPLANDAALFAGLTAGDYYVVVSSSGNVQVPGVDPQPGIQIFDPNQTQSGNGGWSTGDYLLNVRVVADTIPPQVVVSDLANGAILNVPPTIFTVQFNEAINLPQSVFDSSRVTSDSQTAAVSVLGANGEVFSPRLQAYDPVSNTATFLMFDRL